MSRIAQTFARLKAQGKTAFMPFVTIGYPELDTTTTLVPALFEAGADMVELGVPFSDPIAEGPTIQRSSFKALENGVTLRKCFETARAIRAKSDKPFLFMGYYNPVFAYGVERYAAECAANGVDGLIIPDLPPEEAAEARAACDKVGLDLPAFVAPTSTPERISKAVKSASGFIYCVSLAGVTGARANLPEYLPDFIARVRAETDLPLVLGFGISKPEHFATVSPLVDGAIIGSALVDVLEKAAPAERINSATAFIKGIIGA
ncbi:MAG TPA: tryptophan synthase subunit alpha [Chloroflexia bacterium]|nr:tryptophan synthase subunit alpha [Chloroflexia bacterium]